jgi:hypothetical protein
MLVFSAFGKTEALATSLRMSRPDIGLAMIPTVDPGTDGSAPFGTTCPFAVSRRTPDLRGGRRTG